MAKAADPRILDPLKRRQAIEALEDCICLFTERYPRRVANTADPRDFDLTELMEAANAWLEYVHDRCTDKRRSTRPKFGNRRFLPKPLNTGQSLASATDILLQARHILDVVDALMAWYRRDQIERARGRFHGLAARRAEVYSTWVSNKLTWSGRSLPKTEREMTIEWNAPNQGRCPPRDPRRPFRRSWATTPEWR